MRRLLLVALASCHPTPRVTANHSSAPPGEHYVFEALATGFGIVLPNHGVRYELELTGERARLVTTEYVGEDGSWFWLDASQRDRWQRTRTATYEGTAHRHGNHVAIAIVSPPHPEYDCTYQVQEAAQRGAVQVRAPGARDTSADVGPGCFNGLDWSPAAVTGVQVLACSLQKADNGDGLLWGGYHASLMFAPAPGVQIVEDSDDCHTGNGSWRLRRL
jgi:hypothetical protein